MKKILLLGLSAVTLAACSGNPISTFPPDGESGGGGETPPPEGTVDVCSGPIVCAGDVRDVRYNSSSDTVRITGTPFDEEAVLATFVRADEVDNSLLPGYSFDYPTDNINGFAAYENDDPLALKPYLAIFETSDDGSISVGQVSIMEGYRDYGYSGYFYILNDEGSIPSEELATYSGQYAGIVALAGDTPLSSQAFTSEGGVFFEVDFTDGFVSGGTVGRTIDGAPAEEIVFDDDTFDGNSYAGNATSIGDGDDNWGGSYQGFFGGDQAETTGGVFVVERSNFNGDEDLTARETGNYIATKDDRVPVDR